MDAVRHVADHALNALSSAWVARQWTAKDQLIDELLRAGREVV